jgi:hypothetical protein
VIGHKVTGTNGNSIFLPAAGCRHYSDVHGAGIYGVYWTSSLYTDDPFGAWHVYIHPDIYSDIVYRDYVSRAIGYSVRPVCP